MQHQKLEERAEIFRNSAARTVPVCAPSTICAQRGASPPAVGRDLNVAMR